MLSFKNIHMLEHVFCPQMLNNSRFAGEGSRQGRGKTISHPQGKRISPTEENLTHSRQSKNHKNHCV
jgi:hypothetical protein